MNLKPIEKVSPLMYQIIYGVLMRIKLIIKKRDYQRFHRKSGKELEKFVSKIYEERQGRNIDWNNLEDYSEKMQWAKIYDRDRRKTLCADKYKVRKWVARRIGEEYLIPLLGVWNNYSEIDFDSLPNKFVLKTNHGSRDTVIVTDKNNMSLTKKISMRNCIEISLLRDYSTRYGEMHYSKIPPKIIAEKLMVSKSGEPLNDYKFLCFDGVPYFCWVDVDRFSNHRRNVYDMEWNLQPWNQGFENAEYPVEKPENFDEMIRLVKKLAKGFSHVRVDLYNIDGKIYFGEMTFTNASGFEPFTPPEADRMLGDLWKLDMNK